MICLDALNDWFRFLGGHPQAITPLVYSVDVENADPHVFQLLYLGGHPKREENDRNGKEVRSLYLVDERFDSALELIGSSLLTMDRNKKQSTSRVHDSARELC